MCYSIRTKIKNQLGRFATRKNYQKGEAQPLNLQVSDLYYASGFQHPKVLIYTNTEPFIPLESTWGLLPSWTKDISIWNKTLNARGESIFEKPSFRESAKNKRCLIYVDGFYEYHHFKNKTYPYYIFKKDESPMIFAGLWNDWANSETGEIMNTFSIVTTTGNPMMSKIHNNPKLEGPRMPVILPEEYADEWLKPINSDSDKKTIKSLIVPYNQDKMNSYTVGPLSGKNALGNVPEVNKKVFYPELEANQGNLSLF
ncbi:SOS response-associated peptidase [Mangrovibacterium diazotrophicum]|uniref:Abasic site processing protein n=1 Tax=Mangrovibacterium diazotrophicum TaxID=1261403 RepID=A0A419W5H8_9BACT|nr:SOS response-associated peptidase [Mangrovibacterium diazotrophicum]RKD90713.1 putative SOS response-associated peptidase YedK [Mangrovibacterium diazotrophicum]